MRALARLLPFLAGAVFGVAFLAYCGSDPSAHGDTPDAGISGACNCPAPERSTFRSGSRLQAQVLKSDDGAMTQTGWYDAQFKASCEMLDSTDGSKLCVPGLSKADNLFSDPECKTPLFPALRDGGKPLFLLGPDGNTYEAGPAVTVRPYYHVNSNSPCGPLSTESTFYTAGAPTPESAFVRMRPGVQ